MPDKCFVSIARSGDVGLVIQLGIDGSSKPSAGAIRYHPITWHQENLCEKMIAQTPCLSAWQTLTLGFAALITPSADLRRLERAFRLIQMRHDVLRLSFLQMAGKWRAAIHPEPRATPMVEEIGPRDAQGRQAEIDLRFGAGFPADGPPLSLHLLRFGSEGDVILLQISHLVTDGFGSNLIVKDFVSALIGLPLGPDPLPYEDFARAFIQRPKAELDAGRDYWSRLISASPPTPIGLARTGMATVDRYKTQRSYAKIETRLSAKATRQVEAKGKRIGCTPFSLLAAGFFEAIRSICGAETLDFGTMLGRSDARLERWSGQAVTNLHAVCRASDGPDFQSRALALHDQIRTSMQHLPHPAVQPQHAVMQNYIANGGIPGRFRIRLPEYIPRASKSSVFATLFATDKPVGFGKYTVTKLSFGAVSALSELTLAQSKDKERLHISFVYDYESYSKKDVSGLADLTTQAMLD